MVPPVDIQAAAPLLNGLYDHLLELGALHGALDDEEFPTRALNK